jgi:diguanylate cyclase (GGDEF)-like protein
MKSSVLKKRALLCVDDEPMVTNALRVLFRENLEENMVLEVAQGAEEAMEICMELEENGIELEVVVVDYIMPGTRGDELLVAIHQRFPRVRKILLTGQSDIEGIQRAINRADLYRFIEKPWNDDDLILTVKSAVKSYRQECQILTQNDELTLLNEELEAKVVERTKALEKKNFELEQISITDRLTQLYNRHKLDEVIFTQIQHLERYGTPFGIILLDVDNFKSVNDTYGHQIGDKVLIEFSKILREQCRKTDIVGRWGGEEFMVICPENDLEKTAQLAENLRKKIENMDFPVVQSCTASFGVTAYLPDDHTERIVARADTALYKAKEAGRNRVECS